ncbi:MAG: CinA family protein [Spirochaetaceae bacterium]|jgi:PncC family amidohydrolase|nr:CinA family protein [Spirochaetaceae bacterium]
MATLSSRAKEIVKKAKAEGLKIATAESCTGGLIASSIVSIPGASDIFWGAFVSYAIDAKVALLGLDKSFLDKNGAVNRETAAAMAKAALEKSGVDIALSATGYADTGLVYIGLAKKGQGRAEIQPEVYEKHFEGGRNTVRKAAALFALALLEETIKNGV